MHRTIRKALPAYPVDLTASGAIDQLLLAHTARFGSARMADDDDTDSGDDDDKGKDDDTDSGDDDDKGKDDDTELGPKGEKALQAEKTKRREAQAQLREWRELGKTPAEIRALLTAKPAEGEKDKDKPDADAIRAEIRRELTAETQRERVLDKIEAKAGKSFADPDDAAALVMRGKKPDHFLDADGNVDAEAIEDALKELLEKKPYLAADAAQSGGKRFGGGADGGTRNDSRPKQLTRDDLKRMSPQQIEKARLDGRLDDLLGAKQS